MEKLLTMSLRSSIAGIRDSPLTVQGVLQAERLGRFLTASDKHFTHIFASDLQRAFKTAEALIAPQLKNEDASLATVRQLPILREQDFGFYEGRPFYARQRDSKKSGKDNHRSQHQDEPELQDMETKESMTIRTNAFVAEHLKPLILGDPSVKEKIVAIVSHGIILSHLWRSILSMFSKHTVTLASDVSVGIGAGTSLEYIGAWSNTGYLELDITCSSSSMADHPRGTDGVASVVPVPCSPNKKIDVVDHKPLPSAYKMHIKTVNGKDHLKGLKRTRGVGSSQHDEGQKKIESFFKKTKAG
ncbi:MAG: hypothetical protein Q9166_000280 [cf. Caloplaca sp. 2 TL-2023]